ncbi:MAG: hypothetical protein AAFZ18_11745 [Myxococcota bacterium]
MKLRTPPKELVFDDVARTDRDSRCLRERAGRELPPAGTSKADLAIIVLLDLDSLRLESWASGWAPRLGFEPSRNLDFAA